MKKKYNINKNLLMKAKRILRKEFDDNSYVYGEEEEIICALCLKYNFRWQFINNIVFIYSAIDQWYFDYTLKENISLFHKNKLHSINKYHLQRKFDSIYSLLRYIKKHDNIYCKPKKPKGEKIFEKLERHRREVYKNNC